MALFRRKGSANVEAVQWFKDGDHPSVIAGADRLSTKGGTVAYIENLWPMSTAWVTVKAMTLNEMEALKKSDTANFGFFPTYSYEFTNTETGQKYYRKAYPFNFWNFKGEKQTVPRDELNQLFEDCLMIEAAMHGRKTTDYSRYGLMTPPDCNGRLAVFPGNWIVKADGKTEILEDAQFRERYESAT